MPARTLRRLAAGLLVLGLLAGCKGYDADLLKPLSDRGTGEPLGSNAVCGDGKVDGEERCDTAILAELPGTCPIECHSDDPCEPQVITGRNCATECVSVTVTKAMNRDGCCPKGIGAGEDSDCGGCGDGIVGPLETCDPPSECHTRESCSQGSACIFGSFSGDPERCTASCNVGLIRNCVDDDECCPGGCSAESDNDCSASCRNGVVEPADGETCEPGDVESPCPESCDDGLQCTTDLLSGSPDNCSAECIYVEIQEPIAGDGCCPDGAHSLNDADCQPECGNLVTESGETCDPCPGSCDDQENCTVDALSGSASNCSLVCSHTPITQPAQGDGCCPAGQNANGDSDCVPVCGNAVIEAGEECEGGSQCDANCQRAIHSAIIHRYSFDGSGTTITDSVGDENGTARGGAALDGAGSIALNGGTNGGYVELPAGMFDGLSNVTLEIWVQWSTTTTVRQRLIECGGKSGTEGTSFIFITPRNSSNKFAAYMNFTSAVNDTDKDVIAADAAPLTANMVQVAASFDGATRKLTLYQNGVEKASDTAASDEDLADIADPYCYIGHSVFDSPPEFGGTVYEVRFYNHALTAAELAVSRDMGPDP